MNELSSTLMAIVVVRSIEILGLRSLEHGLFFGHMGRESGTAAISHDA